MTNKKPTGIQKGDDVAAVRVWAAQHLPKDRRCGHAAEALVDHPELLGDVLDAAIKEDTAAVEATKRIRAEGFKGKSGFPGR